MKTPNLSDITQKWVDLLTPFTANYKNKLSASELSRLSKIPQQTASRCLNQLTQLNLIEYTKQGRNKLFYLDSKKQTSRIMLNIIENQKALEFQLKTAKIAVIIKELLNYCESLVIFGSYASGKFHEKSDLDIAVLGKCNKQQIKKIKQRQIIQINEHYTSYKELSKILASKNPLSIEIVKNHILFGDVPKIIGVFLNENEQR